MSPGGRFSKLIAMKRTRMYRIFVPALGHGSCVGNGVELSWFMLEVQVSPMRDCPVKVTLMEGVANEELIELLRNITTTMD